MAKSRNAEVKAGFARAVITPPQGALLLGYFQPQPAEAVLDELYMRVAVFQQGRKVTGVATFDLHLISEALRVTVINECVKAGLKWAKNSLLLAANHTHTGPDIAGIFGWAGEPAYITATARKVALALRDAVADLTVATFRQGRIKNNPYAFCRRYFMKDGGVVTNPGKGNPGIVRPEGPIDEEIGLLSIERKGQPAALFVNLSNHTDTIGGPQISADWTGRLELAIQNKLGRALPVFTFIAPQGDINHFDVASSRNQTSYAEACRIGEGYAKLVLAKLPKLKPVSCPRLRTAYRWLKLPYRRFTGEQLRQARKTIRQAGNDCPAMTSEDLARESIQALQLKALQLLACAREARQNQQRRCRLDALSLNQDWALVSLPGEAFSEIGRQIRSQSPAGNTFVVTLANGYCGYVPMPECFARGGYETLPRTCGGARQDTAPRLIREAGIMLKKVAG